jgi:hypothetical protein
MAKEGNRARRVAVRIFDDESDNDGQVAQKGLGDIDTIPW